MQARRVRRRPSAGRSHHAERDRGRAGEASASNGFRDCQGRHADAARAFAPGNPLGPSSLGAISAGRAASRPSRVQRTRSRAA
jgi:hypothetical protein